MGSLGAAKLSKGIGLDRVTGYTPAECYEWLKETRPSVQWSKVIWNAWVIPKHQFMGWLVAHGALNTNDKLVQHGMEVDDKCYLCGQSEECLNHLFLDCLYSKKVIHSLQNETRCQFPVNNVLDWCVARRGTKVQQGVQAVVVLGAIYQVWCQRNKCKMDKMLVRPEKLTLCIMEEVKSRIIGQDKLQMNLADLDWLKHMNIM
ncbi:uncharacterized protein LOC141627905 [Silene latifolia]|uniref:uncharacterized protein LOC141627905 n=1 Tax=Silene latifolia TaxID=37657 RepID=UPI003D777807